MTRSEIPVVVPAAVYRDRMTERALMITIQEIAARLGWMTYHTFDSRRSNPGFPDLVLVRPADGRLMVVECKTARGRLRIGQREWIDALLACGVDARIVRPADLDDLLADLR